MRLFLLTNKKKRGWGGGGGGRKELLERVQNRAMKMMEWNISLLKKKLREMGLFSLENRRLRGDLIHVDEDMKGSVGRREPMIGQRIISASWSTGGFM